MLGKKYHGAAFKVKQCQGVVTQWKRAQLVTNFLHQHGPNSVQTPLSIEAFPMSGNLLTGTECWHPRLLPQMLHKRLLTERFTISIIIHFSLLNNWMLLMCLLLAYLPCMSMWISCYYGNKIIILCCLSACHSCCYRKLYFAILWYNEIHF